MARRYRQQLLATFLPALEADPGDATDLLEVAALLDDAKHARASDIHLDPQADGYWVRLRIDGQMADASLLAYETGQRLVNQFKVQAGLNPLPSLAAADGSFTTTLAQHELTVRVSAVTTVSGEKLAVRFLDPPVVFDDIEQLGLSELGVQWIRQWMDATSGMLLVTGPTGAGKTTTLYTLLHRLALSDSQVVTVEDPVEYIVPGINQLQVDSTSGMDVASVASALLRLDPDYVLLGELRDRASTQAAINVAVSGRSLMATLHSRDAVGAVTTLRQRGLDDAEIATSLGVVVAQRLVRQLCRECRHEASLAADDRAWLEASGAWLPSRVWEAPGCEACHGLGFTGRTGIFEVWQPTSEDLALILQHGDEHRLRRQVLARGEPLLFGEGLAKVEQGVTTLGELFRVGALLPR
ncbi:general secretion pathway protein E/type IV pilus assembly protein PilB [Franzmannia pantelleriensis]|uniref:General secretion pathway protein E/type IV pilus assembly protein PilB n=1 Tax=Franzmannia pantelleriensis TaxID=48727 RepID=A0A1G9WUQ8_9GAMM|nr:ATPase, T2SS/T4P/T4SS family [Halomonas pantelleriensis]SDM87843.1 general secretion pathway protein E/type IV pilus assembly protein PilB [Halomonas pantelleriensis]